MGKTLARDRTISNNIVKHTEEFIRVRMSPRLGCIPDFIRRKCKTIRDINDSLTVYYNQPRPCVIFERYKFTMLAVSQMPMCLFNTYRRNNILCCSSQADIILIIFATHFVDVRLLNPVYFCLENGKLSV